MDRARTLVAAFVTGLAGMAIVLLAWHLYQDHLLVDQIRTNSQQQLIQAAEQIKQQQQARPQVP